MAACARQPSAMVPRAADDLTLRVVRSFPHDRGAFTQGLVFFEGKLYESTGLHGRSSLRRIDPESGAVEREAKLDDDLFGEGLARVGGRLYQLTWQNGRVLVWNLVTFEREREHTYEGEGWGLCFDGKHLVMSDGSDRLVFRDPERFAVVREVRVRRNGQPVTALNELECVGDVIYANVWQTHHIARIDPRTGEVTGWIDASALLSADERFGADVLNGIAHRPDNGRLLVTGKLWPRLFEVEVVKR